MNKLVPAWVDGRRHLRYILGGVGLGAAIGLVQFAARCGRAVSDLYEVVRWERTLRTGAVMEDFANLLPGCRWGPAVVAVAMVILAVLYWMGHYQGGSRSIYLMRRLPDRWELWRRCLTLPLLGLAASAAAAIAMTLLSFWIYRMMTPETCLPPDQWDSLLRVLTGGMVC